LDQINDERIHAPHHLHTAGTTVADFVEGQAQEIVPGREGHDQPERAVLIAVFADVELAAVCTTSFAGGSICRKIVALDLNREVAGESATR